MVLGTPTTRTPASYSRVAAPRVSSPPIATRASTPSAARLSLIRSTPDRPPALALSASGLVRDEPRIVPPPGPEAHEFEPELGGPPADQRPDDRVQSWAVSAARQHSDSHRRNTSPHDRPRY